MKQKFNLTQEQFEAKHTKMLIKGMKANKVFSYPKELFVPNDLIELPFFIV